jgi:hypothetical protein
LSCCQLSVVSFFLFLSNSMIEVVLVDLTFTRVPDI